MDRELTRKQAVLLGDYIALSKIETKFFLLLVNHSRAGSHLYKRALNEEILEVREQAREI